MELWVVSETRIHAEIEGNSPHGFLRDFPEIPCRIYRDFWWVYWRDKMEDFKRNPRRFSNEIRRKLRDTAIYLSLL